MPHALSADAKKSQSWYSKICGLLCVRTNPPHGLAEGRFSQVGGERDYEPALSGLRAEHGQSATSAGVRSCRTAVMTLDTFDSL
jgi:hypothetical protein